MWGYENQRLFKIQKKAVRIIKNVKQKSHADPIFKDLKFLKLDDVHFLQQAKFYYKLSNKKLPPYFENFLPDKNLNFHSHNTRHASLFRSPRVKHEHAKKCIYYSLAGILNNIPSNILVKSETHSIYHFSQLLKSFLLNKYNEICLIANCYICQHSR